MYNLKGNNMKIGIIGAMDVEIETLKNKMTNINEIESCHLKFYEGMLHDKQIVLVQSGVGKVNAGVCAQILILKMNEIGRAHV